MALTKIYSVERGPFELSPFYVICTEECEDGRVKTGAISRHPTEDEATSRAETLREERTSEAWETAKYLNDVLRKTVEDLRSIRATVEEINSKYNDLIWENANLREDFNAMKIHRDNLQKQVDEFRDVVENPVKDWDTY